MTPNGDRPNRRTRDFGYWKTTQKDSTVCDDQQLHSTYQDNQSNESNEDNFSYNYEEVLELDYADSLNPGYRFSATDSEIIVYYLQRKIETGEQHPECRYYIADFYGDTPNNLANPPQGIVIKQVQTSDGISTCEYHHNQAISTSTNDFLFSSDASCSYSTNLNSMASTNAFQLAYNSYQDSENPQATLQTDEPMEWTKDDISKEIEENLDEENMNQQSGLNMI
nr:hypothetical protein [Tanacetum cinerariifolium]